MAIVEYYWINCYYYKKKLYIENYGWNNNILIRSYLNSRVKFD